VAHREAVACVLEVGVEGLKVVADVVARSVQAVGRDQSACAQSSDVHSSGICVICETVVNTCAPCAAARSMECGRGRCNSRLLVVVHQRQPVVDVLLVEAM
jgi:hypothetical protein